MELTAEAPGYGAGLGQVPGTPMAGDVELRLVADDVPIRGRILDTQGRPIPGVNVRVGTIEEPPAGDLDALIQTGTIRQVDFPRDFQRRLVDQGGTQWVKRRIQTDPDGRFQVDGAGRDRLVLLEFDGPGIESGRVWTMTRVAPPSARPQSVPTRRSYQPRIIPSMVRPSITSPARPSRSKVWSGSRGPTGRWRGPRIRHRSQANNGACQGRTDQGRPVPH